MAILKDLGYASFVPAKADEYFVELDQQMVNPTTETALLVLANRETGGHFKNVFHIRNAVKKLELELDYPPAKDATIDGQTFLAALIEYGTAGQEE